MGRIFFLKIRDSGGLKLGKQNILIVPLIVSTIYVAKLVGKSFSVSVSLVVSLLVTLSSNKHISAIAKEITLLENEANYAPLQYSEYVQILQIIQCKSLTMT